MGADTPNFGHGTRSARWKRAGAIGGLIAAILLAVTMVLLSSLPTADSPGRIVAADLQARYATAMAASFAGVFSSVALAPLVASFRAFAPPSDDEAEWRWTVTLLSAAAAVSLMLAGSALLAAAAILADQTAAVSALFAGAKTCLTFALTPAGVLIVANARTLSSSRTPTRWLIKIGLEIGILAIASSATILLHGDWFGAGEQLVAGAGLLVALWEATIALVILEGGGAAGCDPA